MVVFRGTGDSPDSLYCPRFHRQRSDTLFSNDGNFQNLDFENLWANRDFTTIDTFTASARHLCHELPCGEVVVIAGPRAGPRLSPRAIKNKISKIYFFRRRRSTVVTSPPLGGVVSDFRSESRVRQMGGLNFWIKSIQRLKVFFLRMHLARIQTSPLEPTWGDTWRRNLRIKNYEVPFTSRYRTCNSVDELPHSKGSVWTGSAAM